MTTRRHLLAALGMAATVPLLPRWSFAAAPTDRRLVVIMLRGGLDGLAAVPPWRDPNYADIRGTLALEPPGGGDGALDLDGYFGLHPALAPLHALYAKRQAIVFHALATPYRERSHFDGQDLLENGTTRPRGAPDGWLNRAIAALGTSDRRLGIAFGRTVPLLLAGDAPVASWAPTRLPDAPADFLTRVAALWQPDPLLGSALAEGLKAQAMSDELLGTDMRGPGGRSGPFLALAEAAGRLLAADDGPRIAAVDLGGWDTHAQQGKLTGRLATALGFLARGVEALSAGLGPAWDKTAVLALSEFGRTAAPNGTGGTDHGTAGCGFLFGGAVRGGRVLADWPGLAKQNLHEGRDLKPTFDSRALCKGLLRDHLGLDGRLLTERIFPGSAAVKPLDGLVRT